MRKSCSSKNRTIKRKIKKMCLISQIFVIFYVTIFILALLTSSTKAEFIKREETSFEVQSKTWWEKSELKIIGTNFENEEGCLPIFISVDVQNIGNSMTGASSEVYYVVEGNLKKNGKKIAEGMIHPLNSDEIVQISYQVQEEGIYVFKVYQTLGLENRNVKEIWSEQVVVKCDEDHREQLGEEVNDKINIPSKERNDNDLNNTEKQSSESEIGGKKSKENEGEKLDAGVIEDDN
ncbi:amyloid fiber anchoring/assembly protein TapA [Fervidibacillus halotolerans]|uniref:Amyloid fiber anchoring/assembly protein TapA n=1 Tax=Fervidibacillus halotolerans TaxID=2980027 RepID=A0A9E8LYX2_9BACI|nr:amyloid fiber anchoring/assembly protein TapA [Fervidibacillus halotolerans]WAA11840.1 amyloid fiber anchoring/assembly protein TapA [Fervidibacillus halotolerans]